MKKQQIDEPHDMVTGELDRCVYECTKDWVYPVQAPLARENVQVGNFEAI